MSEPHPSMTETPTVTGAGSIADRSVLQAVIDAMPARAIFLDMDARYRYVNREFLDFVGKRDHEVIGRRVAEVLGETVARAYAGIEARLKAGEAIRWEGWMAYEGAGRRYVQESLTPYAPDGGPVLGIIALGRDLTDLKRREQELAEQIEIQASQQALHKAVVESALDCIVVVDEAGIVVAFNQAAETVFGYRALDAIGCPISSLIIPPEFRARHTEGMSRYMLTGNPTVLGRRIELEAMRADGSRLPVELAITEVRLSTSRLFTAHLRDLTEAYRARDEIERQRDALYQTEKLAALGSLLAGVAHELNNPLSIVIGQALMMRETATTASSATIDLQKIAARAGKIELAANRCARIVKTFLAMARQRKADRSIVDVAGLIDGAVELLGYGLRTTGIEVTRDIADGLPQLSGDSDQLHQVVVNLLMNAKQALEDAAAPRRVRIAARFDAVEQLLVVTVTDNGPGVPDAIRGRIFDPFFTTKPQGGGTGIGLPVSRGFIEGHGGRLTLEPAAPEGGACFTIRLPLGEAIPASASGMEQAEAKGEAPRRRALIIDDEIDVAELLADMMSPLGFEGIVASTVAEAKHRLAGVEPIDIIVCDIRMPGEDGPAFFDWLRAAHPELAPRIGFVTGDTLGPTVGRFLTRTGRPAVEKPFLPADIRAMVEQLGGTEGP